MNELKGFEPVAWRCTHAGEMYHFAYAKPNPSDWDTCIALYTADQLAAVVQQRDELLAALEFYANPTVYEPDSIGRRNDITFVAKAAIAKVQP